MSNSSPHALVTPSWITPALLALTVRVWSKRYGRPIDDAEALDILIRVGRLMDVLKSPLASRPRADDDAQNHP